MFELHTKMTIFPKMSLYLKNANRNFGHSVHITSACCLSDPVFIKDKPINYLCFVSNIPAATELFMESNNMENHLDKSKVSIFSLKKEKENASLDVTATHDSKLRVKKMQKPVSSKELKLPS